MDAAAFAVPNITVGEDIACAYTTLDGKPLPEHALTLYLKPIYPVIWCRAYLLHFDAFPIAGNAGKLDRKSSKQTAFERLGHTQAAPERIALCVKRES